MSFVIPNTVPKLVYKQTLPTHTSMQTNAALMTLSQDRKTLRLIDVPGHPRIRDQFQEYLPHAKAVAFVVDSSTISRNGAAVAEYVVCFSMSFYASTCSQTFTYDLERAHVTSAIPRNAYPHNRCA